MTKKILISMDERLLGRVDEAAKTRGLSRSRFLSELAQREVGSTRRSPEERREIRRAVTDLRELFARNGTTAEASEEIFRAMRDERTEHLGRLSEK
ncbi:MAG: type II toxin-antitoxin system HicB family antitoxin [Gaiellaceae bacterium MAG52_C11]|nr:type II toxin-antitoxin system HicB family antitoxin [Candidatus Gaiellasilicea maunaloa]